MSPIDELFTDDDSDNGSISTNTIKEMQDWSKINPDINARYDILKIFHYIKQIKNEWKWLDFSADSMIKGLCIVLLDVVKKL